MQARMNEYDIKLQKKIMLICLIGEYLIFENDGGTCHIIIADGNYDDQSVVCCYNYSIEHNDIWGLQISKLLLELNPDEREQVVERSWEIK